ncbi:hypothetical protein [Bifidobacterium pseudolongum]|uniref:hypothetical protein n=1 Tax=Bifidobacterium pseudolongum TaxID=1694 RepID=UPI0010D7C776|nr:hypothetical protein [Bifidobacterium pseudolongum]RYQ67113.1 peptidase [Bifidobacterium pseudolongum subsp. globosum]
MSEFRSTHAPRTGITAQVIHDLGRGMTVRECADAHHLPEAFIAQIVEFARAHGELDVVALDRGCVTKGMCTPDPDSVICAGCPLAAPNTRRTPVWRAWFRARRHTDR